MSGFQHREGFGSLFPNRDKKDDRHPDMKGDALFNGVIVEVAAWKKTTAGGKEYLSIKIGEKRQAAAPTPQPAREAPPGPAYTKGTDDDAIPF